MYFTYVLLSRKDNRFYVGFSGNIDKRVEQHNNGYVASTKHRTPLDLVYYEAFKYEQDARKQDLFYKTSQGRRILQARLQTVIEIDKNTKGAGVANRNRL